MVAILGRRRWFRLFVFISVIFAIYSLYLSHQTNGFGAWRHVIPQSLSTYEAEIEAGKLKSFKGEVGLEKDPQAVEFCQSYHWSVFKTESPRKIYDLVLISNELDWLEIRLNTLHKQVDYFVIVESNKTFTGLPKPLHVQENWDRFAQFHSKIIYRILDSSALNSTRAWDHEDLQRNALYDQVFPSLTGPPTPNHGDVLLVSDIDEIPRPATLTVLRVCDFPRRLTLRSRFYYYSFQWLHRGPEWAHPQATTYSGASTIRPANLRNGEGGNPVKAAYDKADLWNAAWHCSTCFSTLSEVLEKLSSFSHVSYNRPEFRDKDAIVRKVRKGLDLFDRKGEIYDKVPDNVDVPLYVINQQDRYAYLLNRDPGNANFRDYSVIEAAAERISEAQRTAVGKTKPGMETKKGKEAS
jgi:beta-1,4-mannosyl-glycoprotein beta-1,4-N-acetylglucosaminyltransferase